MSQTTTGGAAAPDTLRKRVLGILFLIVFVDLVGFGMIVTLLPRYGELYQPSPEMLGLFMSTYSFFQLVFSPVLGRLSDSFGRRPVLLVSLVGAAFGYLLLGIGGSLGVLFLSRMIAGASAGNIATAQAVIADTTTPETRAKGMGVLGAAFGLGFIIGPAVGGLLFKVDPSLPGYAAAATSLVAFVLAWFMLPETRNAAASGGERPRLDWRSLAHALAHPALGLCLVAFFLAVYGFSNFESSFVLYADQHFRLDSAATGWIFLLVGVIGAIVQGGLIGMLTKRFGEVRLVVVGLLLCFLALGLVPYMPSVPTLVAAMALLAVGTGLVNPSLSSLTSRVVDRSEVGGVMGIYQGMGSFGRIIGPFTGVEAFKHLGMAWPFRIAALAYLAAAAMALLLTSRLRRADTPEAPGVADGSGAAASRSVGGGMH